MSRATLIAVTLGTCAASVLLAALAGNPFDVFHHTPSAVETYLRKQTPLGTSQADVVEWLRGLDIDARVHTTRVEAGSDYPRTDVGGDSFIHESVAHYWWPLRTDVEAFYLFDAAKKLVDLRVRKTVDGP